MGRANASHEVTNSVQIVQPPGGYENEFAAPADLDCYFESNTTDNVVFFIALPIFDFTIFAQIPDCITINYAGYSHNYCANINHYSGYLSQRFSNSKYRSCTAGINLNSKRHYINHYSG
jgi:hypothetical protein